MCTLNPFTSRSCERGPPISGKRARDRWNSLVARAGTAGPGVWHARAIWKLELIFLRSTRWSKLEVRDAALAD